MKKLYVPIITPFREDETVNYDALKKLVRIVLDDGADGIYAGGSSAECFLMTEEERMKTLETVIEAADGAPVIAHIGAIGSQLTERLARHAERAGAAMVSSVPPFYYSFGFEQIKQYYWDLTDAVNLPMVVYYIPTRMGYSFTAGQLAEIMNGRDNIKSVKFTSTDYYMLQQVAALTGKKMISGKDECFISAMAHRVDILDWPQNAGYSYWTVDFYIPEGSSGFTALPRTPGVWIQPTVGDSQNPARGWYYVLDSDGNKLAADSASNANDGDVIQADTRYTLVVCAYNNVDPLARASSMIYGLNAGDTVYFDNMRFYTEDKFDLYTGE